MLWIGRQMYELISVDVLRTRTIHARESVGSNHPNDVARAVHQPYRR